MTAIVFSILALVLMCAIAFWYGERRAPGTPLTWGEAFAGALFVFGIMLVGYAILPSQWLNYAAGPLKWRSDKIGVPLGPLHHWRVDYGKGHHLFTLNLLRNNHRYLGFLPVNHGVAWPTGITFFGRGKVVFTAAALADIVATMIYAVTIGLQVVGWKRWQERGKRKVETPELTTSAYGRPLVRKA